jgi:tRNA pseudouridine55 synthase
VTEAWDGLLAIDKPAGPTSHDIVASIRAATGARRVGHTGTLDPPATGLLLLVLGRATRLARFIPDAPKTYRGLLALGVTTTTDDLAGELVQRHAGPLPDAGAVVAAAALRVGRQMQVPPAFSARQVDGTRLYRAARRGVRLEAPATEVVVERLDLTATGEPNRFAYEMVVSTGTYVRAVVRDLGIALGCGAAVATLRRTAIGPMTVETSLAPPAERPALREAARSRMIPLDAMPLDLLSVALRSAAEAARFSAGAAVPCARGDLEDGVLVAVRSDSGTLLGVAAWNGEMLRPSVVVPPAD